MNKPDPITTLLKRGTANVAVAENLEKKLRSGKKLRVYMGIDPSGSALHVGHAVPLGKLRAFQELGHQVIFLIGDYTARIGDPTGKSQTRVMLTEEQIQQNMRDYVRQASKILDMDTVEVRYNSEWYTTFAFNEVLRLASIKTVAQFLHREDFQQRFQAGKDISLVEFLYPLMQGYDSVALQADVEVGGTDQTFNMLVSRDIQAYYKQAMQDVVTVPILEGLDGKEKMSKSLNNFIAIEDTPQEMFGKIMSIPDELIIRYFTLLTNKEEQEIVALQQALHDGANPRDSKVLLAKTLISFFHTQNDAQAAEDAFVRQFSRGEIPEDIQVVSVMPGERDVVSLLVELGMVPSRSEARRMITQGGVQIQQQRVLEEKATLVLEEGIVIQVGKRKFIKITLQ